MLVGQLFFKMTYKCLNPPHFIKWQLITNDGEATS
ncbi:hypothetical protein AAUPMC_06677 [Pasteurella multocida subsp. multocida str. Anand1_cattle]|nr:hypothetical protein AAUPMC_06677 [Pasteurella multocida subsp. multocida str. Anand1_cattle]